MISSILGQADEIADLVVEVSRRSGGIPLYIKQLLPQPLQHGCSHLFPLMNLYGGTLTAPASWQAGVKMW